MNSTKVITEHILPDLPYPLEALTPYISAKTLAFHYGRHHKAYIEKLNACVKDTPLAGHSLEDLILEAEGAVYNNAAQAWSHAFYWNCMTPDPDQEPSPQLLEAIRKHFGSLEGLFTSFKDAAIKNFGSGWTWLVIDGKGELRIQNTDDADTPQRHGNLPLLTCDVWEHAYYLDYMNARNHYVDAFWQLVNWNFVDANYQLAKAGNTAASEAVQELGQ